MCRIKRALYGLKQAPRVWYSHIDSYLLRLGFTKSEANPNIYFIVVWRKPLILILYVDDLILTWDEKLIVECKTNLALEFDMKDIRLTHYFLGLEIWRGDGEIFLRQGKYDLEILKSFRMQDCRPMATPLVTNWWKIDASIA